MDRRFEIRKHKILQEAEIKPQVFNGMLKRLEQFAQPFINSLRRREQKEHAHVYISGLLSDLKRKNTESIAYRHDLDRRGLQRFIGSAAWDHQPLLEELARQVGSQLGQDDGVIVFDPSGHKKCGNDSVGVQRQWLGRLGKVDNGQVGVYMAYASRKEHALVDTRLYLPKQWAKDKARRKKCGVPKDIRYQTRHELALDMLSNSGKYLPHAWIAGDDEMGRSSRFRRDLRVLRESGLRTDWRFHLIPVFVTLIVRLLRMVVEANLPSSLFNVLIDGVIRCRMMLGNELMFGTAKRVLSFWRLSRVVW